MPKDLDIPPWPHPAPDRGWAYRLIVLTAAPLLGIAAVMWWFL